MSAPLLTTKLRALLRASEDGMTVRELTEATGHRSSVVFEMLKGMPDVYIDRWRKTVGRGRPYSAVWAAVVPPSNCPYPNE
jgi:DNA-binding transcriptional regulator GbsR (MarR family)